MSTNTHEFLMRQQARQKRRRARKRRSRAMMKMANTGSSVRDNLSLSSSTWNKSRVPELNLKATTKRDESLLENEEMWKYFHLQVIHYRILVLVLSLFIWQKYFLASNLSSSWSSHAGSLFINKELKKIVSWHNRHLHTYLVHDIKNSHKMTVLTAVFLQL